ncbi:GNAT family N-acetyltransferase [Rubrobacter marinus]|nr:GNAT family N-acetyltransferase [Rubrobacter marinus]
MDDVDLRRILELRETVRWSGDPRAFELLRGMDEARWAVAEDGGKGGVVGMVGAVPLGEVGILCHLAVHHGHRGYGLGSRLTRWAVSYLLSRGVRSVRLDSTRAAEGLYRSMGFAPVFARTEYRLEGGVLAARLRGDRHLGGPGTGGEKGLRVAPLSFGDLPELYGVDLWSYGADRSAIILATLRQYPGWGLVARDASGRVRGYLVRSASGATVRVGPFMASSPDVARALLTRALETDGGRSVEVSLPAPKGSPAHALLREFGFVGRRDRLRMELGETAPAQGLTAYATTPYLAT